MKYFKCNYKLQHLYIESNSIQSDSNFSNILSDIIRLCGLVKVYGCKTEWIAIAIKQLQLSSNVIEL